ncbi:hypothetical protein MHK_004903 [Candidatus Magnetomorum sp. HK-1]|nr:hypothetical protein MHK_004903 [Candidatus Magnetomorum sp. HK-1]
MIFSEINKNQSRILIDTIQLYNVYLTAYDKSLSYKGGMHWKKSKGKEYLFKTINRNGNGKSLGPRSSETEKILSQFKKGKKTAKESLKSLKRRLTEQSRFCKAAKINHVPKIVTKILRILHQKKLLGKGLIVVGTNAMYAYEMAAGVYFDFSIMATQDMDILWDIRPKLTFLSNNKSKNEGLLGLLREVDKSFEQFKPDSFRAINKDGYMVDLIQAEPKSIVTIPPKRMGNENDICAAPVRNCQWLLSSPKITQVIIGEDGFPSIMVVPDPRAFALHKIWLADQIDREPIKKKRDLAQGLAVIKLIMNYLPQYSFEMSELKMFPKDILKKIQTKISIDDIPSEFKVE